MKRFLPFALIFSIVAVAISSCIKERDLPARTCPQITTAAPANEVAFLKAFIDSSNLVTTQDSRGFFYSIDSSASTDTAHPESCSDISVTYTGTFLNGTVFDSTGVDRPTSFNLANTLVGWREAVPLMKGNAKMTLYLPPSLAYGEKGYLSIPGNSYLIFQIRLWGFN